MGITKEEILDAGERWLLVAPATSDELANAERELGLSLPLELKEFLAVSNGVKELHPMYDDPKEAAEEGLECIYGLASQILNTTHFRTWWIEESPGVKPAYAEQIDQFIIVADDGAGNHIAFSPIGRDGESWGLGLLDHETREYEPWPDYGLLDLLREMNDNR